MEKIEQTQENVLKKEGVFNFPEIADLKEGMVSLVQKLQTNIDEGKYDALVSDEVGGRIPTLVLRRIIRARNPGAVIDTYFVSSGKTYFPEYGSKDYAKLIAYLKEIIEGEENVLLVSQYAHSGKTLNKLTHALKDAEVPHVDIAVMESLNEEAHLKGFIPAENIYAGTSYGPHIKLEKRHNWLAGVAKTKEYDPRPHLLSEVIAREGRGRFISQEEFKKIFDIQERDTFREFDIKMKDPEKSARYDARVKEVLSETELKEFRDTINKAREDINVLAEEILKTVWPQK